MDVNAVYKLMPMLNTPGYRGLASLDDTLLSFDVFLPTDTSTRQWQVPRLATKWDQTQARAVCDEPEYLHDYPCIDLTIPAFSQRAVDALRDLLEPNGEILPLAFDRGQYYAFNVTTVADVINRESSEIEWLPHYKLRRIEPVFAREIRYYDFYPDRVAPLAIFRTPEHQMEYYVTERFAERVRQHGLKGFNLQKVWPLPRPKQPGGIAEMERRANRT